MRTIQVFIRENILVFDDNNAGNAFDHLATQLQIDVSDIHESDNEYRLLFQTQPQRTTGDAYLTDVLSPDQGNILFALPQSLMREGTLLVQLQITQATGTDDHITHTATGSLTVGASISGNQPIDDQYTGLLDEQIQIIQGWIDNPDSVSGYSAGWSLSGIVLGTDSDGHLISGESMTLSMTLKKGETLVTNILSSYEVDSQSGYDAAEVTQLTPEEGFTMQWTISHSALDKISPLACIAFEVKDSDSGYSTQHIVTIAAAEKGDTGPEGPQGEKGDQGEAGYTPVRGVDYWTESDIEAMEEDIIAVVGQDMSGILGLDADFENGTFTRMGEAEGKTAGADFDVYPMYGGRRRCNVTDGGVVVAMQGEAAYTETGALTAEVTVDGESYPAGTAVQVMVYQPKFYYRVQAMKREAIQGGEGYHLRRARYMVSGVARDGFRLHPAFVREGLPRDYILLSAYEGSLWDADGGEEGTGAYILDDAQVMSASADKLSSIAGAKPISGSTQQLTRANARTLAHNRGNGWELRTIAALSCSQLLMVIEYASFNVQSAIGQGVCKRSGFSAPQNGAVNTGGTASLGDASGSAEGTAGQVSVTYRGEENLWGNLYCYVEGINPYRTTDPDVCEIYVADHDFADSTGSGAYAKVGFTPVKSGTGAYISAFGYCEDCDWIFVPTEMEGASSQPVGDGYYINASSTWKTVGNGGRWNDQAYVGVFDLDMGSAATNYRYDATARLCYIPPEASGEDTGWIQPAAYMGRYYRKVGNRVSVRLDQSSGIYLMESTSGYTGVFTLPEGYRPSGSNRYFVGESVHNGEEIPVVFQVDTATGEVKVKKAPWSTQTIAATHAVNGCEFSFLVG